jgi:transcription antitermination factor NusG
LTAEPDLYPGDLLDRPELGCEEGLAWWAMYCRPQREKQLMRHLRALDVPFYSPMVSKRFRSPSGRQQTSYIPLFKGYVFVYGDDSKRYAATTTSCVSRSILVPDPVELTHDLRQLQRLIESGAPLTAEARLQPGMRVRVRRGAFADFEGVVVRRAGKTRLLVAVTFLQQGVSVLLDDCQLEQLV